MFCKKCGTKVIDEASFCPKCGNDLRSDREDVKEMSSKPESDTVTEKSDIQESQKRQGNPAVFVVVGIILIAAAISAFFVMRGKPDSVNKSGKTDVTADSNDYIDDAADRSLEDSSEEDHAADLEVENSSEADVRESFSTGDETKNLDNEASESVNTWADAYYDYLIDFDREYGRDGYDGLEYRSYNYIYVNDDDIPELLLQGQDEATGNLILTYNDGKIDELQTARLYFDYIEKENRLRSSDGHMGYYYDYIFTIRNGKWETEEYGEYYVEDNTVDWDDDDLIYEWNGKKVSKSEYDKELQKAYDVNKAKPGSGVLGYEEILDNLRDDASGIERNYLEDDTGIHRYEVILKDVTWDEAMEDCKARGGYLARINTTDEKYHIEEMLRKNKQDKLVLWLGGRLNPEDGHYHWFDGESYTQPSLDTDKYYQFCWLSGEPSFKGTDAEGNEVDENYMCMFQVKGMWEWNDAPADISPYYEGKIAYICEYD